MIAIITTVVKLVSSEWTIFSVDQKNSTIAESTSSFFSLAFIGPSSLRARSIASFPPATSSVSGGMTFSRMKYRTIDMIAEKGAAAMNHSGQVIALPSIFSMWPTAIMF